LSRHAIQSPVAPAKGIEKPDLRRKATFDRLEQRPAFPSVRVGPGKRQRNERHESDAANPVGDKHYMQSARNFDVVNHGCSHAGSTPTG
jgi:hypothetical protein